MEILEETISEEMTEIQTLETIMDLQETTTIQWMTEKLTKKSMIF